MVFDAHERAFAFFRGACARGIYDNMKTAVDAVFVGKARQYNRRFLQMCSHHLVEPVACTPASGWEKGQVENQVGLVRERFFTPSPALKAMANSTPGCSTDVWSCESPSPYRMAGSDDLGGFRGGAAEAGPLSRPVRRFHALPASVSKTCWSGSTTTNTRSTPARSVARSNSRLRRPDHHPSGRPDCHRASALLRPRQNDLRSLALRAGPSPPARRAAQRRAVPGLGFARRPGADSA